jgi:hypothetical protein
MKSILKVLISVLIISYSYTGIAQSDLTLVKGLVVDTAQQALPFTTVVLLQPTDSVLYKFAITNKSGIFTLDKVKPGNYVLQISYMGFQNMARMIEVKQQKVANIGTFRLAENYELVDEVSIEADHIPILFKKDTIEYNANAFKTKDNAVVEDLLKQLPGVEVERDGSIKAQGEKVEKLLVDGKEFFGDNPEIATKNLPANAVDKVQVFDKLSELAEFTGVDDGDRMKTINLEMKEDHKKGYFGNATLGYGGDDRYKGKFNLNRFTDKMQFSVLGSANNINEQGFSFDDYIGFMGGLQNLISGGGGTMMLEMDDLPMSMGMNTENGLYTMQGGGANLNIDLTEKSRLIGNYFYNHIQHDLERDRFQKNFLFDDSYSTTSIENNESDYSSHQADLKLKHQFDTLQNMTASFAFRAKGSDLINQLHQENLNLNGVSNSVQSSEEAFSTNLYLRGNLVYRRKLGKKGRSLVVNLSYNHQEDTTNMLINSQNDLMLLDTLGEDFATLLLQEQLKENQHQTLTTGFTYTEPIRTFQYIKVKYRNSVDQDNSVKDFYDIQNTQEQIYNELLSNDFRSRYNYNNADLIYQFSNKKHFLNISAGAQFTVLEGEASEQMLDRKEYWNFVPYARYEYKFSTSNRLSASYSTNVSTPYIRQLQPVIDNSNPLNLYIGNPELEPEFTHSGNVHYMLHSSYAFTSLFTNIGVNVTRNKITNSVMIDDKLVRIVSPVNVEEDLSISNYTSFNTPIKFIRSKVNLGLNLRYNDAIVFINGIRNDATNWTKSVDLSLENRKKTTFDLRGGLRFNHNTSSYSSSSEFNNLYMNYDAYIDFTLDFLKTWTFSAKSDYRTYLDDDFNTTDDFTLLSASISKSFLKHNKGELKLSVVDLLNQNLGISRINQLNYLLEEKNNTIGRYFLLSFTYSLSGYGS